MTISGRQGVSVTANKTVREDRNTASRTSRVKGAGVVSVIIRNSDSRSIQISCRTDQLFLRRVTERGEPVKCREIIARTIRLDGKRLRLFSMAVKVRRAIFIQPGRNELAPEM